MERPAPTSPYDGRAIVFGQSSTGALEITNMWFFPSGENSENNTPSLMQRFAQKQENKAALPVFRLSSDESELYPVFLRSIFKK